MKLSIGISTCPNDTYIFAPMLTGLVPSEYEFDLFMDDVQILNRMAIDGARDILKVSYGVIPEIIEEYAVLKSGGALGFGCGPLLVAGSPKDIREIKSVAIPGENTSAFLFFRHFFGDDFEFHELRFDHIMPAVKTGQVDAGLVIHEGRFVYERMGLTKLCDLGTLWEEQYNAPIPLGAIVLKRELIREADRLNELIRESISYSENKYDDVKPFIQEHAAELDDETILAHIDLYVNEYSKDLSSAVSRLSEVLGISEDDFI